jgi:signal transduction histidine kinase
VGSGAGLGLSIVAGIAEEHGGTASAGNAPDGGAVFRIELPYGPATPASSPGGATAATPEG